ncbi:MAG: STAS domain-containing protein [Acidimicrobiales bacterium]
MTFSAEVRHTADQATLSIVGELNALAHDSFEAAAERALAGPPTELVLDFSGTSFVNSTGIALIVSLLGRARALRVLVIARGLDDHHRHIFTITRLSDFMNIEEPEEAPSESTTKNNVGGSHA